MAKWTVRIDACFNFDVEADTEEEACELAEEMFDEDADGFSHFTETLAFGDEEED